MQTWATQLHPYVWASHRHFSASTRGCRACLILWCYLKKDMYKNSVETIFALQRVAGHGCQRCPRPTALCTMTGQTWLLRKMFLLGAFLWWVYCFDYVGFGKAWYFCLSFFWMETLYWRVAGKSWIWEGFLGNCSLGKGTTPDYHCFGEPNM